MARQAAQMSVNDPEAQAALAQQLRAAIGTFLVEFAALESLWLGLALRALLVDEQLVDHLGELMDLSGRLKLLERMAEAKQASALLLGDVQTITNRAGDLLQYRNDVVHHLAMINVVGEPVASVRRRKSRRKLPAAPITTKEQFLQLAKLGMHTLNQIEAYTREAVDLQRSMLGIAERLDKHRRGVGAANV